MAVTVTIQGTPIEFPSSGESPNWAPAVIEFAQAVEAALSGVAGTFDVAPQILVIDAQNPGTNVNATGLSFPVSNVRGAEISYSVYRTTSTDTAYEFGTLKIIYNANGATNQKWEISRDYVGDGKITFTITDIGQVQFTTATMAGTGHSGKLSYAAKALLQS